MRQDINQYIAEQFHRASSRQSPEIQAIEGEFLVEVKLADCDRLGCLLNRLDLGHSQGRPMTLDPSLIEKQLTYLGEPLKIIETEGNKGRTILRSLPPRIDGDVISFFEMVTDRAHGLSMLRYKYDLQRRERVPLPAPLTRETLTRLIIDLIELVGQS